MRHTIARFHVLPVAEVPAVEAAARRLRPWIGAAPIDTALRVSSIEVREFHREGLMTTWVLHYLDEREAIPSPAKFFQAPLAQLVATGLEVQDRKPQGVLRFGAADGAELTEAIVATRPTEPEILGYWTTRTEEALGVEAADQRMREDASVPELVANCHAAFGWLLECMGRISSNSIGLLTVRDTRRRRWLTSRWSGLAATVSSY